MASQPIHFVFALALINFANVQAGRVLLALYALHLGAQPLAVGVLAATFSAFPVLLAWAVGRLTDRFGSRWLLMFGAAGGACGMLLPYLAPGLPALYAAAATNGFAFTFYTVSLQNLVGTLGRREEHARNFGNFSLVAAAATLLGPLISGFSIDHAGFPMSCLILVLLPLLPLPMLALRGGVLPGGRRQAAPAAGLASVLADRSVLRLLATSSLVQVGLDLFQFYMPIYGHDIGLSATAIGVVLAAFAGASIVVRIVMPALVARFREETVLAYAFFFGAASFFVLPFFKSALALGLIGFAFGLGMGCGPPITMMLTYTQSAEGRTGEALGLRFSANHFARMVGPIFFGAIGSAFGLFPVFWLNALLLVSGGVLSRRGAFGRGSGRE